MMRIDYVHASKYGNGAAVAAEFKQQWPRRVLTWMFITSGR